MSGIPRHEVEESFRLAARDEWWLPAELVAGIVAYVAWVAITWSLAGDVARAMGGSLGDGVAPTGNALVLLAVLWLVVPALVGVYRLRSRVLNFRGNLERLYRFERPGVLLAPPIAVLYVAGLAWIVAGTFSWHVYLLLVAATAFLVVRTTAYSYRVFAFSQPVFLHLIAFVTFVLQAAAGLVILGTVSDRADVVASVLEGVGLSWTLDGTTVAGMDTPLGPALAVVVPVALIAGYLLAQTAAAVFVRTVEPDVTPADIRGGQRYPPAVRTADGAGPSPQSTVYRSAKSPGPSSSASGSGRSRSNGRRRKSGSRSNGSSSGSAGSSSGSDSGSSSRSGSAPESGDSTGDAGSGDDADDDVEEVEDVSHTRVFTPPDGVDAVAGDAADGESAGDRYCPACGQAFSVDTEVRFCPNCGEELD